MAYENSGIISKNKYKKNGQPDITGTATINGIEMRIAGWAKRNKEGEGYYSLKFSEKDEQKAAPAKSSESIDTDIPF